MKTFRLLIVALLLAASASAQRYERRAMRGEYSPTVYLISVQEVDTIYNYGPYAMQQAAALNRMAMDNATQDYIDTHRPGFQQTEKPQFVFASKNNRFSFSIGGFVSLRAGYDFDGIVDNIDFVPYDIPVPGNYNSKQKLMMRVILYLNKKARQLISASIPISRIMELGLFDKLATMKYDIPNDKPEMFDDYIKDIDTSIAALLDPNAAKTGAAVPAPAGIKA